MRRRLYKRGVVCVVVSPERVEPIGAARFHVEFHRRCADRDSGPA